MTREDYNNLTDEQRYSYILKLEEEKKVADKALEKVLESLKKNTTEERYITFDTISFYNGILLRASDIIRAQRISEDITMLTIRANDKEESIEVKETPVRIKNIIESKYF